MKPANNQTSIKSDNLCHLGEVRTYIFLRLILSSFGGIIKCITNIILPELFYSSKTTSILYYKILLKT